MDLLYKKLKEFQPYSSKEENDTINKSNYDNLSIVLKKLALAGMKSTNIASELKDDLSKLIEDSNNKNDDFNEILNEIRLSTKKIEKDNKKLINGLLEYLDTFEIINKLVNKITDKDLKKNFEVSNDVYKQTTEDLGIQVIETNIGDTINTDIHKILGFKEVEDEELIDKVAEIIRTGYRRGNDILRHVEIFKGKLKE